MKDMHDWEDSRLINGTLDTFHCAVLGSRQVRSTQVLTKSSGAVRHPTHYIFSGSFLPSEHDRGITMAMAVHQTHSNCRPYALTLAHCRRVHTCVLVRASTSRIRLQSTFVRRPDGLGVLGILDVRGGRICTLRWWMAQV
jgi:hypothetical protein